MSCNKGHISLSPINYFSMKTFNVVKAGLIAALLCTVGSINAQTDSTARAPKFIGKLADSVATRINVPDPVHTSKKDNIFFFPLLFNLDKK